MGFTTLPAEIDSSRYISIASQNPKVMDLLNKLRIYHQDSFDHSVRVATIATRLAILAHLSPLAIAEAGLLHDIGKLKVPVEILASNTKLTDEQRKKIEAHPVNGYEMLENHSLVTRAAALGHHQFSTRAYPGRILEEGRNIAEIIAAADQYDALRSERSYKPAFSHVRVIDIMRAEYTGNPELIDMLDNHA